MKRGIYLNGILIMAAALFVITGVAVGGTFEAMSTTGVMDVGGTPPLEGDGASGDLVQLIWIGNDGAIAAPDSFGNPTEDDSLLGTTYIGHGYPFNPNEGKFTKTFDHPLLTSGTKVYVRAFNNPTVVGGLTRYGNSQPYVIGGVAGFDSFDFGSWNTEGVVLPVELALFEVIPQEGSVLVRWITRTETDVGFFNVLRNTSATLENCKVVNSNGIEPKGSEESGAEYNEIDESVDENTTYYYWLEDVSQNGLSTKYGPKSTQPLVAVTTYELVGNHPNPFNPTTTIEYKMKDAGHVQLTIYNMLGQQVRQLVNKFEGRGSHLVVWDSLDDRGLPAPSGMYIYTVEVNGFKATKKMMLMK